MKAKLITLLFVVVLVAGCEGVIVPITPVPTPVTVATIDPTPTQETGYTSTCMLPDIADVFLNHNPCLDAPIQENEYQDRPETYAIYERREDGNGHAGESNHTNPIPIRYDAEHEGYIFDVGFVAGESGFESVVLVDNPTCLLIQTYGEYRIEDNHYLDNINNYVLRTEILKLSGSTPVIIARQELPWYVFPESNSGGLQPFWSVSAGSGTYAIRVIVKMSFATAPLGAWIRLDSIAVFEADSGYCQNAPSI